MRSEHACQALGIYELMTPVFEQAEIVWVLEAEAAETEFGIVNPVTIEVYDIERLPAPSSPEQRCFESDLRGRWQHSELSEFT